MSGKAGVWIDHHGAVIVALSPDAEHTTTHIASHVEKHLRRTGDSPLKGRSEPLVEPAEDIRQREFAGQLNIFYDAVIAALRGFDHVLLFGPGEAKGELHKRLSKAQLGGVRVEAVETADKMTDPQIVAKVRAHFGLSAPRFQQKKQP